MARIDRGTVGAILGWTWLAFMVCLLTLLWSVEGHCAEKPSVTLTASPMVSIASPGRPAVITLKVVILNADEKYNCPGIRWIWPNETESFEESDCLPGAIEKRQVWIRRVGIPSGEWLFQVRIEKAGKVIARKSIVVKVG